jgi:hypothetical protein
MDMRGADRVSMLWQVAEKHMLFRVLKNVQMHGTQNSEE